MKWGEYFSFNEIEVQDILVKQDFEQKELKMLDGRMLEAYATCVEYPLKMVQNRSSR